jgi:hypothetical protein
MRALQHRWPCFTVQARSILIIHQQIWISSFAASLRWIRRRCLAFQLPSPFGLDLLLSPREHVLRRDVADGTVQAELL